MMAIYVVFVLSQWFNLSYPNYLQNNQASKGKQINFIYLQTVTMPRDFWTYPPDELRHVRDQINAGKRTSYGPPSTSQANAFLGQDLEMTPLDQTHDRNRRGNTWPFFKPDSSLSSFPLHLPPRQICECTPLTMETPMRFCKCRCHTGGRGTRRFSRLLLHDSIKPLFYIALVSVLVSFFTFAPTVALFPLIIIQKWSRVFTLIFVTMWVVLNSGFLGLTLMKRGSWLRKGLKLTIAANCLSMLWFMVLITALGTTWWKDMMVNGLNKHSESYHRLPKEHGPIVMPHRP